ncbi:putative quinol monooxygenase [Flagellimonas myxillae]|uniref:putative quinol monooxygenase n=1 Tax=Flagellimonas myxillae TaxID=2942214 RepID=UPI00201F932C|nr:antibiotic biosynthesis monooxygenase [Muricauda myxillae]MCL6267195.1 antibiotic biosynthesis monooxygenase [Muricauda myxillae]
MTDIQVSARLKIKPGKMEEFKQVANSCVEQVKQKDKGTIQYDWFYNDLKAECIVKERYIDSRAVLDHMTNVGELLGGLVDLSTISLEVYGSPSADLKNALEGWDVTYYEFGIGI